MSHANTNQLLEEWERRVADDGVPLLPRSEVAALVRVARRLEQDNVELRTTAFADAATIADLRSTIRDRLPARPTEPAPLPVHFATKTEAEDHARSHPDHGRCVKLGVDQRWWSIPLERYAHGGEPLPGPWNQPPAPFTRPASSVPAGVS